MEKDNSDSETLFAFEVSGSCSSEKEDSNIGNNDTNNFLKPLRFIVRTRMVSAWESDVCAVGWYSGSHRDSTVYRVRLNL